MQQADIMAAGGRRAGTQTIQLAVLLGILLAIMAR